MRRADLGPTGAQPRRGRLQRRAAGKRRWDDLLAQLDPLLDELIAAPSATRLEHSPRIPAEPGVYLFLSRGKPMYVGQTRNLRQRIANHCRPSGRENHATFAFLLARQGQAAGINRPDEAAPQLS